MRTIEFIYDRDCPNVEGARAALREALRGAGLAPQWQEWDRADAQAPGYARSYGSPTILVDGRDIAGMEPSEAPSCRIYRHERGSTRGIPDRKLILTAMQNTTKPAKRVGGRMPALAALPAVGGALLPKLTCAACWPAYTALLGALGIEFADYTPYLLPVTMIALAVALFGLGWRARSRRGFGPLTLGIIASMVIVIGKFTFDSDTVAWIGAAVLIGATVWNLWPRHARTGNCGACCATETTENR